jgi:hypothetical protein
VLSDLMEGNQTQKPDFIKSEVNMFARRPKVI